jgi:hypothetical protein
MAKGKKKKQDKSVKIDRVKVSARNVSRRWIKALRLDRRANPPLETILARDNHRAMVIGRVHDPRLRDKRVRYETAASIDAQARQLYEQYAHLGVKWSAAVQAVKTNWVGQFIAKWSQRAPVAKAS